MEFLKLIFPEVMKIDLREFVPQSLVPYLFDGGTVLVICVILTAGVLVFKAAYDALKKHLETLFGNANVLFLACGYGICGGIAFMSQRWLSGLFVAMIATVVFMDLLGLRSRLLRPLGIVVQIAVFLSLAGLEVWYAVSEFQHTQYVVVLSFDHDRLDDKEAKSLSRQYLHALQEVFRDVPSVRVVPEDPNTLDTLSLLMAKESVVARRALSLFKRAKFCPAMILRTEVSFEDSPALIRMVTTLRGIEQKRSTLTQPLEWIRVEGKRSDMKYFVLKSSLELLNKLKQLRCDESLQRIEMAESRLRQGIHLKETEESIIRRNILDSYWGFLQLKSVTEVPWQMTDEVRRTREQSAIRPGDIERLLDQYSTKNTGSVSKGPEEGDRCAAAVKLGGSC